MRSAELGRACVYWLLLRFGGSKGDRICRAGGRRSDAEKGGTWVITKKEFFDPSQNTVFWQILKTG
jgi:hypothetical protein